MSRHVVLSDSLLRDALAPSDGLRAPASLLDTIATDVRRTPQRRRRPWAPLAGVFALRPVAERRLVLVVALAGLLLTLVAASFAGARLLEQLREDPVVVVENMTPGSMAVPATGIVAMSRDEAWVGGDGAIWHHVDGRWQPPEGPEGLKPGQFVRGLALSPDGRRLAATTDAGVAVREADGRWTWAYHSAGAPGADVAWGPDGSLWTARVWSSVVLVRLTESGGAWVEEEVDCSSGGWFVVVAADGSVWTGGFGYSGTPGLARYDGRTCSALTPPQVGPDFETGALAADPSGGVVVGVHDLLDPNRPRPTEYTFWTDGTAWRELRAEPEAAFTLSTVAVDPTGDPIVWSTTKAAALRLHAGGWEPLGPVPLAWNIAFAPDWTIWTVSGDGVFRIRGIRPAE